MLLSGHSLTDNPLADDVQAIASGRGRDFNWEQQIIIGSPIRIRTRGDNSNASDFPGYSLGKNRYGENKDLLRELASPTTIGANERYDTLAITERHDILDVISWENTMPLLRHYHDRLRAYQPNARTLFFQTWPDIDKANPQRWIAYQAKELAAWECSASKVNLSLQAEGLPQAVSVVPSGIVLARFVERALAGSVPGISGSSQERLNAIFADNVHMTPLGAYVMSAAVYAAIFAETPASAAPPSGINASAASAGAQIAWEVVSEYYGRSSAPWLRSMEQCRTLVDALCAEYYSIRDRDAQCGGYWASSDSPFKWPDPGFVLPAP